MSNKFNKPRRYGGNSYNEHDDRDRKVHFGGSSYRGGGRGRRPFNKRSGGFVQKRGNYNRNQVGPRSRLGEDDVDMGGGDDSGQRGASNRYNPYGRGRGRSSQGKRPQARPRLNNDQLQRMGLSAASHMSSSVGDLPQSDWYKVQIPYGKKSDKDFLLRSITDHANVSFVPVQFHYEQNAAVFYVNDKDTATAIRGTSRKLTASNGINKVVILVRSCDPPISEMNEETKDKLKVCMSNRYDPSTKLLNLENLYHDEAMKSEGIYLSLGRINVMNEVLKIIKAHIPELSGLKLNNNKMYTLTSLKSLSASAPDLESLDLGKNQLKSEMELNHVKELKLTNLKLDGNPLCDNFSDETSYISAIRKKFPKLIVLDGHNLPPPIKFDIEAPTSLPPTLGSNFFNPQGKDIACRFLEEYYKIYDSDDRQALLNAYHENSIFSLCCSFNKLVMGTQPRFTDYLSESRNLLKVHDSYKRQKLLKTGRLNIVALLNQLPKTQHDHTTIMVDITHVSPALISFTVSGIFKERSDTSSRPTFRTFTRTFVTAPQGSGFVIVNEELYITNATSEQVSKSFKPPANQAATATASPVAPTAKVPPLLNQSPVAHAVPGMSGLAAAAQAKDLKIKMEMVKQFSQQSGMNEHWSEKCLSENSWDYEKSAKVFLDVKSKGGIPPEAFVKS